jgi:hypothetical protein
VAAPQLSDDCHRIFHNTLSFAASDKRQHGSPPLFQIPGIALTDGLANQFRYGRVLALSAGVQSRPQIVIQIKLSSSHDV